MDFTTKPLNTTPDLSPIIAQEIYTLIKRYGTSDVAFKNHPGSLYEPRHYNLVDAELDHIIEKINLLASGRYQLTPAVFGYEDVNGVIYDAIPATYFIPAGKTEFKAMLQSDLLDTFQVLKDFVQYKGFDYATQWTAFLNSYNNEGV